MNTVSSTATMEAIDTSNPIHRISVEQFHRMIEAGVFDDGDRVELIDGKMRDMPPVEPAQGSCSDSLTMGLASKLTGTAIVRVQGALELDDGTELYPDLAVLDLLNDRYRQANPKGDDALLVIEVADTSIGFDLGIKLAKYARAGVRHYWVADIRGSTIHDYRDPDRIARRYRQLRSVTDGLVSITIAGVDIRVDVNTRLPG
jgi:Uma2 family endonuclease